MVDVSNIERKYTRFPAFSDSDGVKLQRNATRKPFTSTEPWILTESQTTNTTPSTTSAGVDFTESETLRARRRTTYIPKSVSKRYGHSLAQQDELKKHREQLPDYGKKPVREETKTGKVKLFGNYTHAPRVSSQPVSTVETAGPSETKGMQEPSATLEQQAHTPFVPTFTPKSLIPDQPKEELETKALLAGFQKTDEHYLLFEESNDYVEKKPEEPSVRRFNKQEPVAMTRGQYKAAFKTKEKKKGVLNRDLSNLIDQGQTEQNSDPHFE